MAQKVKKDAKSPYAKYAKKPYRYSDEYYAWREKRGVKTVKPKA